MAARRVSELHGNTTHTQCLKFGSPTRQRGACGLKGRPATAQGQRSAALGYNRPETIPAPKGDTSMDTTDYDDTDLTPEEMIALAEFAFDDADSAGPIEEPAA